MKAKSIDDKIASFGKLIKSFSKKKKKPVGDFTKAVILNLETNFETLIGLQNEIRIMKETLKTKKKELESGVKNLKKESRKIKAAKKLDVKTISKSPTKNSKKSGDVKAPSAK